MTPEIRPYQDEDLDDVLELWRAVFPDGPPWNEPTSVIATKLKVQRELFFVAILDGRLVGTAMSGFDGHRGWVYAVAVAPDVRRRGTGAALMRRVEEELARRGCVKLNLQVRGTNAQAARFYERIGYTAEDRISMGKRLGEER